MAIGDTWVFSIAPQGNRVVELVAAKDPEGTRPRPDYVLLLNFFDEIGAAPRKRAQGEEDGLGMDGRMFGRFRGCVDGE